MRHFEVFTGRIGEVKDIVELQNGNCVVNFSVAETPRVKKGNDWVDGDTIWTNVAIFGDEARNLHRSVKPGTFVTVIGDRRARSYTVKDTNEERTVQSIVADQVAVSITKFTYIEALGNVNYAKEGRTGGTTQAQPKTASQTPDAFDQDAPTTAKKQEPFGEDPFNADADPFTEDPFGSENDDPFGLNT